MPELWTATLDSRGPHYEQWLRVFGCSPVPLMSPRWQLADLPDEKRVQVYQLNLRAMTLAQRARLLGEISASTGEPIFAIEAGIQRAGYPIRMADVRVSYTMRALV